MKKILILAAVLLFGTASVFAQNAWEVKVDWQYLQSSDCSPGVLPSQNYGIAIKLEIVDVANGPTTITDPNTVNTTGLNATTTTFTSAQAQVEDYCEESYDNTPSFKVTATVAFVELSTQAPYCYKSNELTGQSCNDFYSGDVLVTVVFN